MGGLTIETGGLFEREVLFISKRRWYSAVLHKELEYKVEKLKYTQAS